MSDRPARPDFIRHFKELQQPFSDGLNPDLAGRGSPLGRALGLVKLGIHYEVIPPGNRSSLPHAESEEEEFVYIIEGKPDVWIDGVLHPLVPGDAVGFPAGTGIAHSFLNNSSEDIHILVIGEANKDTNRVNYPLNPARMAEFATRNRAWLDAPKHELGPHDGKAIAGTRTD
ncbi:MAG: cupin domain-containing protein [Hyphomicrobiales bacterium]|nr:MAG: cupin domain-containing protein [Hyphomicrobiales bacterium]